jgi:hypothetical protein
LWQANDFTGQMQWSVEFFAQQQNNPDLLQLLLKCEKNKKILISHIP